MIDSFHDARAVVCSLDLLADPDGVFGALEMASKEDVRLVVISVSHAASWFEERTKDSPAGRKLDCIVDATTDHFHLSEPSASVPFSVRSVRSPVRLGDMLGETVRALASPSDVPTRVVLDSASALLAYNGTDRSVSFLRDLVEETDGDGVQLVVLVSSGTEDAGTVKEALGDVLETDLSSFGGPS